jgi:hypothetical protein
MDIKRIRTIEGTNTPFWTGIIVSADVNAVFVVFIGVRPDRAKISIRLLLVSFESQIDAHVIVVKGEIMCFNGVGKS